MSTFLSKGALCRSSYADGNYDVKNDVDECAVNEEIKQLGIVGKRNRTWWILNLAWRERSRTTTQNAMRQHKHFSVFVCGERVLHSWIWQKWKKYGPIHLVICSRISRRWYSSDGRNKKRRRKHKKHFATITKIHSQRSTDTCKRRKSFAFLC